MLLSLCFGKTVEKGGNEQRCYNSYLCQLASTPRSLKKEAEAYLASGWGEGAITEFNLEYLYGPEPEVSGE